jgi:hypothetical protein
MLPPPSEPQPTGASVALGGAALAASAMLTGLALRNKSPLPLAAGLAAAAAGLSMMKKPKGENVETESESKAPAEAPGIATFSCAAPSRSFFPVRGEPSKFQVLDESDLDDDDSADEQAKDWVDADAVAFTSNIPSGMVPPLASAILPSHATSFPLLDDDGKVIVGHQMLPLPLPAVLAESAEEFGFPLGPLIWEPETEESRQICSGPEDDFLWFGSRRTALPQPYQLPQEMVVPMPGAVSLPDITVLAQHPAAGFGGVPDPSSSYQLTASAAPESVASILESLRAEAARRGESAALVASAPGMAPSGGQHVPGMAKKESLSFADWMLASQQPSPDATASHSSCADSSRALPLQTVLPPARQAGEPPKFQLESPHPEQGHPPVMAERDLTHRPSLVYHRSVAPVAPVQEEEEEPGEDRPLTLFLAVLILTTALLAVAIWGHGYQPSRDTVPPPWTQEPVTVKERSTASAVPEP